MSDSTATSEALRLTFPGSGDAPLALTLVRLLGQGRPVATRTVAEAMGRDHDDVSAQVGRWRNVERGNDGTIVGFCGLTLRPTAHRFEVFGRRLHTWCAWDTLFLPAMLGASARVRATCPVTSQAVELVVAPDGVEHAEPNQLWVSFPPLALANTDDITGSFCCHVHFLAGPDAARSWQDAHPKGEVLDLAAAYALGRRAAAPLLEAPSAGKECC